MIYEWAWVGLLADSEMPSVAAQPPLSTSRMLDFLPIDSGTMMPPMSRDSVTNMVNLSIFWELLIRGCFRATSRSQTLRSHWRVYFRGTRTVLRRSNRTHDVVKQNAEAIFFPMCIALLTSASIVILLCILSSGKPAGLLRATLTIRLGSQRH